MSAHQKFKTSLASKLFAAPLAATFSVLLCSPSAYAQPAAASSPQVLRSFHLANTSQPAEGNEIINTLRSILAPDAKFNFITGQNVITLRATADQVALAQTIIEDLDKPKKTYRLTYTTTESDNGKRIGTQHFTVVVASGQRVILKQGSRIPILTGTFTNATSNQSQVTYLDVGLNFDATVDESASGVRLHSKVEQSTLAPEPSNVGHEHPIIRQTLLDSTSFPPLGKPIILGGLDVPGSTRHLEVEAVLEIVK